MVFNALRSQVDLLGYRKRRARRHSAKNVLEESLQIHHRWGNVPRHILFMRGRLQLLLKAKELVRLIGEDESQRLP